MKKALQFLLGVSVVLGLSLKAQSQAGSGATRGGMGVSTGAPNAVTDPGFPSRLGHTVGLRAVPPVTMPPRIGNINHPGMQPLPMTPQPLPTGSPFPIPNINFPGGVPGRSGTMAPNPSDGSFDHGRGHRFPKGHFRGLFVGSGTVIVGVPIYPYTVYVTTPTPTTSATTEQMPSAEQPSAPTSAAEPVITLLAFKDGTILAAVDYWLDEDFLRYITLQGIRASVPLDRLDLPLTQRLNRERHVRFVLEARP
ncbi:MAG: hypothetical protein HYS38_07455 [Acidobacteria bacterium]|nr:hypothetical protein [Acidobacteriota bacterium]